MTYKTYVSLQTQTLTLPESLDLEGGGTLEGVKVAYRSWGTLNPAGDNAVLVCHALTGSADVDDWWAGVLGPGKALDPETDFVVATNVLGGCYGTTGPSHPGEHKFRGADFPSLTVRDQVRAQAEALKALNVRGLRLVVGGSMGGMQALEWGAMEPLPVEAVSAIGTPAQHHPWAVGLAHAQRQAIRSDPAWKGGHYPPDDPPKEGLAVARIIAMCSYRSPESFHLRFRREEARDGSFQVESYLRYQGGKLGDRFDANSYLTLTHAMDTHDLARGRGSLSGVLAGLRPSVHLIGIRSDVLYPPQEVRELAQGIPGASLTWLDSPHGHDAFLIEQDEVNQRIRSFRSALPQRRRKRPVTPSIPASPTETAERRAARCA